jgi:pheromone a factor receptor
MGTTDSENRRILLIDLLIGVGIPILHVICREWAWPLAVDRLFTCLHGCNSEYVVSTVRYIIFEDFGPTFSNALMLPSFFLFSTWPLAIGIVSFFYCGEYPSLSSPLVPLPIIIINTVTNTYTFYKRGSQCRQMMISGFNQNQYLRLMIISSVDAFATIPFSTLFIVTKAKLGTKPWKSWADTHRHYSAVNQIAGITWKSVPEVALDLEVSRWLLVACTFLFFALFGFTVEAREQYKSLYKLLTRHLGISSSTPDVAPHAYVVFVYYVSPSCFIGAHVVYFRQDFSCPLCEEKRWRHGSSPSYAPKRSG